jgi:hypothetical protein
MKVHTEYLMFRIADRYEMVQSRPRSSDRPPFVFYAEFDGQRSKKVTVNVLEMEN